MRCSREFPRVAPRCGAVAALVLVCFATFAAAASAAELIPSAGLTRSVDSDQAKTSLGLALRAPLLAGFLDAEVGAAYRSEDFESGAVTVRTWPITASAWLDLSSTMYAGGGLGWYNTTFHDNAGLAADHTEEKVGLHLGAGVRLPLSPSLGLDLSGRYVFLGSEETNLVPRKFNANSWTTQLGLAVRF